MNEEHVIQLIDNLFENHENKILSHHSELILIHSILGEAVNLLLKSSEPNKRFIFEILDENSTYVLNNVIDVCNQKCEELFHFIINKKEQSCDIDSILKYCDVCIDHLWEELHTKEWCNVSKTSRQLYAYHQWLKSMAILAQINNNKCSIIQLFIEALKCIDYGLIMSPDLKNQLLANSGQLLHRVLVILLEKFPNNLEWKELIGLANKHFISFNPDRPIDSRYLIDTFDDDSLTPEVFQRYFQHKRPLIWHGAMKEWPCMSTRRWTLSYILRSMAFRWVPVEIGSKYTDENWSQQIMLVKDFVQKFILNNNQPKNPIGYLAQYNLFDQMINLFKDIYIPDLCAIGGDTYDDDDENHGFTCDINAWFGPKGTVSPLHFDARDNFLAQIIGHKYVRLYSDQVPQEQIYPNERNSLLWNTSQVDIENIDHEQYPLFKQIDPTLIFECYLQEGDMLFIPKHYWHFVKSSTDSFSVNFWWN